MRQTLEWSNSEGSQHESLYEETKEQIIVLNRKSFSQLRTNGLSRSVAKCGA